MKNKISAAVLAGGLNSRMNFQDKSMLSYNGKTFLNNILAQLNIFDMKMIISNNPEEYFGNINASIHKDIHSRIGPLGGIHSSLVHSPTRYVFITTCDMPLIKSENIEYLCSFTDYDIVMPIIDGKYEMLFALYSKSCLPQIEKMIESNKYKITGIFKDDSLKVKKIIINEDFLKSLKNINTESDYRDLTEKSQ